MERGCRKVFTGLFTYSTVNGTHPTQTSRDTGIGTALRKQRNALEIGGQQWNARSVITFAFVQMTTVHVVTLAPTLAVPAQLRSRGTVYSSHPLSSLTAHARGRALRRRCLATTVCAAHGPSRRTRGQRRTNVGVQTLAIPALMKCGGEVEGAREGGAVDVWTLQVGRHTRAVEAQVYALFCHRGVTFVVAGAALLLQTLQHGANAQPVVAAQRTTHRTSRLRDISTYIHAARSVITLVVVGGTRRRHGTVEGVRDAGRVAAHVRRGLGTVRRYTRIDGKGN